MEASDRALCESYGMAGAMKQMEGKPALLTALKEAIALWQAEGKGPDASVGNALFAISALTDARAHRRVLIVKYLAGGKLPTNKHVNDAIAFLKKKTPEATIDTAEFEAACGAGVSFSPEQIREKAHAVVAAKENELVAARYAFPVASLHAEMREGPWAYADQKAAREEVDAAVLALLGPRTEADDRAEAEAKEAAKKAAKAARKEAAPTANAGGAGASAPPSAAAGAGAAAGSADSAPAAGAAGSAARPEDVEMGRFHARELAAAVNSKELIEAHNKETGGVIRTRFPPEPNGYLHIGHAKSMCLNFELAFTYAGVPPGHTFFRYDDTNPDAESKEYIDNQAENVAWMGWKPFKTTHSSDYFPHLYEYAKQLIRMGKAFVCHQTKEDIEASREAARNKDMAKAESPWRNRSIEESLAEFEAMRAGKYEEGKATLRLKIDMGHVNPTLWDPVAYRIKYTPHPHTGDSWCIYPSYDYSHAIIDSIEHIDYSLCTLEFEVRRDLYYWTVDALNIWRPHVWEFGRLNLTRTVLSKRKILKLVKDGSVRGWDDPRIATINGLRRRGYPAEAINNFVREVGVTRNETSLPMERLEFHVRTLLDRTVPRAMAVLRPILMTLSNVPADAVFTKDVATYPQHAKDPAHPDAAATHKKTLTQRLYVDSDDWRDVDSPDFYGLAPNKVVGLRYAGYVRVTDVRRNAAGAVEELIAEYDDSRSAAFAGGAKVKGNIHWVSGPAPGVEPAKAEVRLYSYLFTTEEPGSGPDGDWEKELNPHSEIVLGGCPIDAHLARPDLSALSRFQWERVGYFVLDKDSDVAAGKFVYNMTVSLKESEEVKKIRAK